MRFITPLSASEKNLLKLLSLTKETNLPKDGFPLSIPYTTALSKSTSC
ncbi:hypothetical protein B0F87_10617 [Methylobacter tundripaludum]|uniref:Uncharacterized protein n=1 Tax=Methylobacter tundripaludum TaxID=173365 RepID=A0A2S6HCP1_9GAMM|nr:hypothetical protein B0F87_10617 [Methylobacter tundripaludum]